MSGSQRHLEVSPQQQVKISALHQTCQDFLSSTTTSSTKDSFVPAEYNKLTISRLSFVPDWESKEYGSKCDNWKAFSESSTYSTQHQATPAFLYGTAWKKDATADLVYQALNVGFTGIDTINQP